MIDTAGDNECSHHTLSPINVLIIFSKRLSLHVQSFGVQYRSLAFFSPIPPFPNDLSVFSIEQSISRLFNVTWVGTVAWQGQPQNIAVVRYT